MSTGTEWRECPGAELALLCQRGLSGGTSAGKPYEAMATSSAPWGPSKVGGRNIFDDLVSQDDCQLSLW